MLQAKKAFNNCARYCSWHIYHRNVRQCMKGYYHRVTVNRLNVVKFGHCITVYVGRLSCFIKPTSASNLSEPALSL